MATIQELIRRNYQRPVRKVYIKRKLATDGSYETEWVRVDNWNNKNKVINWGSVSIEIDHQDYRISGFNISTHTLIVDNSEGLFNSEDDSRSIWAQGSLYLNRKYTKIKIDCGYLDEDGTETGVATVFEGVIDSVKTGDDQKARIRSLSYVSVLKGYDITDLSMTGTKSVNTIIDLIMNQTKITTFIPHVASDAEENADIINTDDMEGTYWDIITDLALKSASVPLLNGSVWAFASRTATSLSVFDFIGKGTRGTSDIINVNSFDAGDSKVKLHWIVEGTNIEAISTDALLLKKYLGDPERINLDDVNTTGEKQDIVNELLDQWENPKPVLEFTTRFFINQLAPLDKITISIKGQTIPLDTFIWGAWTWDDGSLWGKKVGAVIIPDSDSYMITRVGKNIDSWNNKIKCEKVVV